MDSSSSAITRREFIQSTAAMAIVPALHAPLESAPNDSTPPQFARPPKLSALGRKPLAIIGSVNRSMSHTYHIAGRFIHGYNRVGRFHVPKHYVHSMYVDQLPPNDLAKETCRDFDIRLARNVAEALTDDKGKLAIDGVLIIVEHGDYPLNDQGQILYPRYEMMEQVVSVFRKTGQTVPVFNDKHLSYSWDKAKKMVGWSRDLKFPFMAGSSLPVVWRRPELELPLESPVEDALVAAYGPMEVYGLHALEALQVMVERRKGGERGVKAVTCLTGDKVWKAGDEGRWSWSLLEAALGRSETVNPGDVRRNVGLPVGIRPSTPAICFLIEYRDGLRGTVLLLNGHIQDFCFAAKLTGETKPKSCMFYLPLPPGARFFDCQVENIEKILEKRTAPYPVERTLLTSGILDMAMQSNHRGGLRVETPDMEVVYSAPADSGFIRGNVASGE